MKKVRWGILGAAKIAVEKVIPAMGQSEICEVEAIASRDILKAREAAELLHITKVYGSYDDLLNDPDIDAVYIPLPNHLHVEWSKKALQAGKHVLCEKPIALSSAEAESLQQFASGYPRLKLMEAFMYRFHPQWQHAKKLVADGALGEVRTIQAFFSYYNVDPSNIRNQKLAGGGGLMDIGCYCISQSRFILEDEPLRVQGIVDYDPATQTDRMASAILDFGRATATFTCSTQLNPFQRFHIFGTHGSLELEIPVNSPPDVPSRIFLHTAGKPVQQITFDPVNQYTLQCDMFSKAILSNSEVPVSFVNAVNNMKVIEAIVESNKEGKWVNII